MEQPCLRSMIPLSGGRSLPLYRYAVLPSTNQTAKALVREGISAVLADRQTAGRGRLGRQFFSEGGLYFSLAVPREALTFSPMLLTTAAAYAVCRALTETGFAVSVKWVNDILLSGKKLCGILAETVMAEGEILGYVVGIGINAGAVHIPEELAEIAVSVPLGEGEKEALLRLAIRRFFEALALAPSEIVAYCTEKSAVLGKKVRFFGAKEGVGTAVGLCEDGGLLVRLENGETVTLTGGEITLRTEG